jgi:hypothetical protein
VLLLCAQGARSETTLDEAVASVDGKVITATQLEFEARVLLINAGGARAAFETLDQEVKKSSLLAIIDQKVATLESDRLGTLEIDQSELDSAIARFREFFEGDSEFRIFLDRHEADLSDVAEVLKRGLRAQRALEGRLKLKAQVSESEAKKYRSERPELSEVSIETVKQRLFALRFASLARTELKNARKQADVRLLGPFAK